MTTDRRFSFEKIAKLDNAQRHQQLPPAPLVELIASFEPGSVLDIGVGTGYFAIPLAAALPSAHMVGADVEPRMFEVLQQHAAEAGYADRITTMQIPEDRLTARREGGFDVILMAAVFHELEARPAYLAGVRQALAPGGRLVIADWQPEEEPVMGPPSHHRIPATEVQRDLAEAGFSTVVSHDLYRSWYVLVASSPATR